MTSCCKLIGRSATLLLLACFWHAEAGEPGERRIKTFISSLDNDDVKKPEEIPNLKESSFKDIPPPDSAHPSEFGPLATQREFNELVKAGELACDGPNCPYRQAILPGTRGRVGSYFPLDPVKREKKLLQHLIATLGPPCSVLCNSTSAGASSHAVQLASTDKGEDCVKTCEDDKKGRVEKLLSQIDRIRADNAKAVKAKPSSYSNPTSSTSSLEAPASTYFDQNQLHCSVSERTRLTCDFCGGSSAFRFRGYRPEVAFPNEQRFVPSYPFSSPADQNLLREFLHRVSPDSINTFSLSESQDSICLSCNTPPMVFDALARIGLNLTVFGYERGYGLSRRWSFMRGMSSEDQLRSTPVLAFRLHPHPLHEGGREERVVSVVWSESYNPWEQATTLVPHLRLHDAVGIVRLQGDIQFDRPASENSFRRIHAYMNGSFVFGKQKVPIIAQQRLDSHRGVVEGSFPGSLTASEVLDGFDCHSTSLSSSPIENCDPFPAGDVHAKLESMNLQYAALKDVHLVAKYFTDESENVFYKLDGTVSLWPSCSSTVLSTFRPRSLQDLRDLVFVWILNFHASSSSTVMEMVAQLTGTAPSAEWKRFDLHDLTLILSKTPYDFSEAPFELPVLLNRVRAGVTVTVSLSLTPEDEVGRLLLPMMGQEDFQGRRKDVTMTGTYRDDTLTLTAPLGDLSLGGGSTLAGSSLRIVQRRSGASLVFSAGLRGVAVVPLNGLRSQSFDAYLAIQFADEDEPHLELVGSLPTAIEAFLGYSSMSLKFVVVRTPFFSSKVSTFIAEAVLSAGAACGHGKKPTRCLEARVVAGLSAQDSRQDMLAGSFDRLRLGDVLGVSGASSLAKVPAWLKQASFKHGANFTLARLDHTIPGLSDNFQSVPGGFCGEGEVDILGEAGEARWMLDPSTGVSLVNIDMPSLSRGPVQLGDAANLPMLKLHVNPHDDSSSAWLQGLLQVGSLRKLVAFELQGGEWRSAFSARYGREGMPLLVRASMPAGKWRESAMSLNLQLAPDGVKSLTQLVQQQVTSLCDASSSGCGGKKVDKPGLAVCGVKFATLHSDATPKRLEDATAEIRVSASGRVHKFTEKLRLEDMDKTAQQLAAYIVSKKLLGSGGGGDAAAACDNDGHFSALYLSQLAATIPFSSLATSESLRNALKLDNLPVVRGDARAADSISLTLLEERRKAAERYELEQRRDARRRDEALRLPGVKEEEEEEGGRSKTGLQDALTASFSDRTWMSSVLKSSPRSSSHALSDNGEKASGKQELQRYLEKSKELRSSVRSRLQTLRKSMQSLRSRVRNSKQTATDLESARTATDLESARTATDLESARTATDLESARTATDLESARRGERQEERGGRKVTGKSIVVGEMRRLNDLNAMARAV